MKLTQIQIEEFNTNGFLIIKNFLNEESCDRILKKSKRTLRKKTSSYRIRTRVYEFR